MSLQPSHDVFPTGALIWWLVQRFPKASPIDFIYVQNLISSCEIRTVQSEFFDEAQRNFHKYRKRLEGEPLWYQVIYDSNESLEGSRKLNELCIDLAVLRTVINEGMLVSIADPNLRGLEPNEIVESIRRRFVSGAAEWAIQTTAPLWFTIKSEVGSCRERPGETSLAERYRNGLGLAHVPSGQHLYSLDFRMSDFVDRGYSVFRPGIADSPKSRFRALSNGETVTDPKSYGMTVDLLPQASFGDGFPEICVRAPRVGLPGVNLLAIEYLGRVSKQDLSTDRSFAWSLFRNPRTKPEIKRFFFDGTP